MTGTGSECVEGQRRGGVLNEHKDLCGASEGWGPSNREVILQVRCGRSLSGSDGGGSGGFRCGRGRGSVVTSARHWNPEEDWRFEQERQ